MTEENPYASLADELSTRFIGRRIVYFPRLPSTMDAARAAARKGAPEGTVVIAGEQTGGRGRLKRAWLAPPGNLALSIILYPGPAAMPCLIMIASLAAAAAVEKAAGVNAAIKWPNDVLVDGKKVCGILIENGARADKGAFAIVGIGINVGLRPEDYYEIAASAAGLSAAAGRDIDPREVLRPLCEEFERLYLQLPEGKAVFAAWRRRLLTLGKAVRARWGDGIVEGVAADVEENGALLIRQADGTLARVVAGDVTLADK